MTGEPVAQTYATVTLITVALGVLLQSARPLNLIRVGVVVAMALAFVGVLVIPPLSRFFSMTVSFDQPLFVALGVGAAGVAVILAITPVIDRMRRA